jgi:hypothetical protein
MSTDSAHGGTSMKTVCGKAIHGGDTPPPLPSISLFALENMSAQPKLKIVLYFLFILFVVFFL